MIRAMACRNGAKRHSGGTIHVTASKGSSSVNLNTFWNVIWILFLLQLFVPWVQRRLIEARRVAAIRNLENRNKSRVITMIHRQETISFLGLPLARYIDIEDSEKVLRAIHLTAADVPIQMILHTPGGLVLAAEQIAEALSRHTGKVQVIVPHYAMSGGTLVAMAADEIVMDPNAVLGPVDPQLGGTAGAYPAASILAALEVPNDNRSDEILIMGDVARKAIVQVYETVKGLLYKHMTEEKAAEIAKELSEGRWTHDFPIDLKLAGEMGLPVRDGVPQEVYDLMELYPQSGQRRPGVEFIPVPYRMPSGNEPRVPRRP
jgi:ClpP class serine protease